MAVERRAAWWLPLALLPACAVAPYQPWYLDLPTPVPGDAFERCCAVVKSFGRVVEANPDPWRVRTDWARCTVGDSLAERRALVFRDGAQLGVVVEVRFWERGGMRWSSSRGDAAKERELGDLLRSALR